ncbi:hypothetical protein SR187_5290 [Streptococcus ruminantium]|uniref:Uncharacterized protein n=1 Tax=Streptococcus ruminantium TaxID=1917441 RepID=A0A2Z5TMY8_9STRE|nr:hypothetical protein SR187_5290 [Streptococcus ruminantium]
MNDTNVKDNNHPKERKETNENLVKIYRIDKNQTMFYNK